MIYLIDDKKLRQDKDLGWSTELLFEYNLYIHSIYTLEELESRAKEIFKLENVVLYHESFLDNTSLNHQSEFKRSKLEQFAKSHDTFKLVIFSGSKNSRSINGNIAHLPVSIVYNNLELFILKYKENDVKLEYLAYGDNPKIEIELIEKLENSLAQMEHEAAVIKNQSSLFIPTFERYIQNPIQNADYAEFYNHESDYEITEFILNNLNKTKYDNIFIPLCYGSSLSDFNGLRLATHIRCTESYNQLCRIFVYGFVSLDYLIHNEYFNILKTTNIFLIPFSKKAFRDYSSLPPVLLTKEALPEQIAKLKLEIPKNYEDSHSIANEWAIYRWSKSLNVADSAINKINEIVHFSLYFKYLQTIYPIIETQKIVEQDLKITVSGNPKVLYIDDEADKGWYEILCKILYDINRLNFDYLDPEFNSKTQEEIIEISTNKIINDDIDLVILDFRLHANDFIANSIVEVTGFKILTGIKKRNPGIQVIVFSATNKIWNLMALQEAGADGFIFKESPENNIDPEFTKIVITDFVAVMGKCLKKIFLRDFYDRLSKLKTELIPRKKFKKTDKPLPKEFVDESLKWFELSCVVLNKEMSQPMITASFVFMFSVLENISNRLINVDVPIPIEGNINPQLFMFEFRGSDQKLKIFKEDEKNPGYFRRTGTDLKSPRNISWKFKILNTLDYITNNKIKEEDLSLLIKTRNDLIHANSTTGNKISIDSELLITLNAIIYNGLSSIK